MISQIQFLLLFPLLLSTTISAVPNRIDVLIKFFAKLGPEEMEHTIQICDESEENAFKISHKYFKKADKNGDGRVDHKEMGNVMDKNFMEKFRDEYSIKQQLDFDLTQFVNDVDGVESEKLAKKMLEKAIEAMKGKTQDDTTGTLLFLFISNILKKNEDGSIGEEQFLNRPKFCALLKSLVELADANGDGNGKVDRREMLALLKGGGKLDQQKLELQLLLDRMENGGHEEL